MKLARFALFKNGVNIIFRQKFEDDFWCQNVLEWLKSFSRFFDRRASYHFKAYINIFLANLELWTSTVKMGIVVHFPFLHFMLCCVGSINGFGISKADWTSSKKMGGTLLRSRIEVIFVSIELENCVSQGRRFLRTGPLLYHKFDNIVIFRSGNLYSLCSPGNQDYQKIIYCFNCFIKKVEIGDQSSIIKNIFI